MASSEREDVVQLLERAEAAAGPPDFDRLMSAGVSLARSGRHEADQSVLAWLAAQPSARRLDIASAVLNGLWHAAFRKAPVPQKNVEALIRAQSGIEPDAAADYSFVQALCQVLRSDPAPPLKERIAGALEATMRRDYPPAVKRRMESLAGRATTHER